MLHVLLVLAPGLLAAVIYRFQMHQPMETADLFVDENIFAFFIPSLCFGTVYLRGFGDMQRSWCLATCAAWSSIA